MRNATLRSSPLLTRSSPAPRHCRSTFLRPHLASPITAAAREMTAPITSIISPRRPSIRSPRYAHCQCGNIGVTRSSHSSFQPLTLHFISLSLFVCSSFSLFGLLFYCSSLHLIWSYLLCIPLILIFVSLNPLPHSTPSSFSSSPLLSPLCYTPPVPAHLPSHGSVVF